MIKYTWFGVCVAASVAWCAVADEEAMDESKIFPGDPIVITAIAEPARASEVPFGIAALTADDIKSLAAGNVTEALVSAEGVHIREYGGFGSNRTVSLRGGAANQTLVMVDSAPLNNPQGGDVDFNVVSLEDIDRVEVMAGPSSALYGAGATAGVVNVITAGAPETPKLSFRGEGGSYGMWNGELGGGVPLGPAGITAGGNFRRTAGFRENDDYDGWGGHAKFIYGLGEGRDLWARGQYQKSDLGVPGTLTYPSLRARQNDVFAGGNVGFDGAVAGPVGASARLFYRNQDRRYADPDFGTDEQHQTDSLGGRLINFIQLAPWNRLALGGEAEHARTVSTSIGGINADTWGALGQEDLRFGDFTTVAGVRYDRSGHYGDAVSPRFGVRYRFTDYFTARAAAGRGFRAPTFDELFWPQDQWGGGNPNLKPEYCWAYEVGPEFRWERFLSADVTYFRSDYRQLINGWPPENVGRAVIDGLEGAVEAAPVPALVDLRLNFSVTYLRTKDLATGEPLDYRPNVTAFGEVRYTHYWADDAWAFTPSASVETVGRQRYAGASGAAWLPSYTLLNARLALKVYYPEFYVAAKNIAAKQYQAIYDYPMPGRMFLAGLRVNL